MVNFAIVAAIATFLTSSKAASSHCCRKLTKAGLEGKISYPKDETYKQRIGSYVSKAAQVPPHCVFQPRDKNDVSTAVRALVAAEPEPCQFAVRSGGHNTIPGASSISDGVNIDLGLMNSTTYHPENDTATVQSGVLWGSVYSTLDKLGVMVVGGRSASVGTGGLVLGGGNSFYAARKGLVCDNVAQFEVVLGNGEIVHANNQDRSDLFQVLKDGGNNFGIVTAMDLKTFEGGPLWGGNVVYSQSAALEILSEFVKFAHKLAEDPYASLVTYEAFLPDIGEPMVVNSLEYTRPVERPEPFKNFLSIEGKMSDSTHITNMTSLSREWEAPNTYRVSFSTVTTKNDLRVLTKAHELWLVVVQRLKTEAKGPWEGHQLYQPMPPTFGKDAIAHGGNVLGLDRFDEALILYEPYLSWTYPGQDDMFNRQAKWLRDELAAFAKSIGADNEFICLDYADADQDPLGSYGEENVRKMKAAAKKHDPQEVFQKLQLGGFKLSKVAEPDERGHDDL
ncbi:hypothetical protein KC332_g8796 [Hortaea werneckii]|uniref:FAD-binding PCMH-type domain-containing protein n=2 Tax=Hortaea werneckii TaxID=91943 RepID=A0A3M7JAL5_HORWE|nr:hypothetical protein KC358_g8402 [Hortaea werneckii]OTA35510.1 hypothetical protein BTJ68_04900 [Hortaea werneckii EXF-2000]KAI6829243.1 hypothetical protein KC350_g7895 [Hortaea werneckii]KAI6925250.1 hypothetical protein KC348_g9015 [Hortaea werneckii]KAI6933148.1 hypothetical protein KC341_g8496 [Hortaea werneckii]